MNFEHFAQRISKIKNLPLPGEASHHKMIPEFRIKELKEGFLKKKNPKKAGVMALFYPKNKHDTYLLLILRKTYEGVHSNQIGFPGGKWESGDKNLLESALRETHEEVGVPPEKITVIKSLSELYISPSNFEVHPFLGLTMEEVSFTLQESEVEALLQVPLQELMDDNNKIMQIISTSYASDIEVPAFSFCGFSVWGATAMMLSEIRMLIRQVL